MKASYFCETKKYPSNLIPALAHLLRALFHVDSSAHAILPKKGFWTSLQIQFEIAKDWDTPGTEDIETYEDIISMNKDDLLWKLIKSQVEAFVRNLLIGKVSNDHFVNMHSKKVLWQKFCINSVKSSAEIGRKNY